jgi:hypothetical protein
MATVDGFTAQRMLTIENETITDAEIVDGELILTTREGTPINVGQVVGTSGTDGVNGLIRVNHGSTAGTARPTAEVVLWVGSVQPTNADTAVDLIAWTS